MMDLLKLLRPKQWVKQGFVFIPLLSLGSAFSIVDLSQGIAAMLAFTCLASCVYILNDYSDLEYDKSDPTRSSRPLVSGKVSLSHALILGVLLLGIAIGITLLLSDHLMPSLMIISLYLSINIAYSRFNLKKNNILGITLVGSGFPIRFAFGCAFVAVPYSYWAITMLMLLALFMLSIKRYQHTLRNSQKLTDTDHEFWLIAAITFAAFFSASYAGFVSSPTTQQVWGSTALLISSIPVALGMVRFIELGTNKENINSGDATDAVAKDLPILILCSVYALIMFIGKITIN
jgi:4-hydroxybenzoate polyprenyltransferase